MNGIVISYIRCHDDLTKKWLRWKLAKFKNEAEIMHVLDTS